MSEEERIDELAKLLAAEISRLVEYRVKADDFGTRPIARKVLDWFSALSDTEEGVTSG